MSNWEDRKENLGPVRSGRASKSVTGEEFQSEDSANKRVIDCKRRELLVEVREYKGDDPMEVSSRWF